MASHLDTGVARPVSQAAALRTIAEACEEAPQHRIV